jgi:aminopeptidase YwaD
MKKSVIYLLVVFLLLSIGWTKEKKVEFDENAAHTYIKDMAADSMLGRKSGQPGGVMGEEYIAAKFIEWDLEPAGNNGSYFQEFTIEHTNVGEGVVFEVITDKVRRNFYYDEDWRVQRYSGSGHFTAEIVFVGYGIHAPNEKHDDYSGLDVKDKILLMSSSVSPALEKKLGDAAKIDNRIKTAQDLGALGVLVFRPSSPGAPSYFRMRIDKKLYDPEFVLLSVEDKVTNFIFKELKTDFGRSFRRTGAGQLPKSFATGVKVFISVNAIFDEKRATRNILAKISGSDPKLKDETIILGGHMDHLGISPMGDVMNGANDNASGTAVAMEIARVMKLNGYKPKRTVIFAAWAGEEQGLLGSEHYADHPTHPIEKTIVYFNMDMVGHGTRNVRFRGTTYGPQIWDILKEKLPKEILEYTTQGPGGPGGSDHTPFLMKGVPAYALTTDGPHLKYHRNRDDTDLINPAILKKTGDLVYAAVEILAAESGDFILPKREEMFYLKFLNLANFHMSSLDHVIANHGDAKGSHVKLQLSILEKDEELTEDALRFDTLKKFLAASEQVKEAKGLALYTSSRRATSTFGQGRTVVVPGLRGIDVFQDDLKWAPVFGRSGLCFVLLDEPLELFDEEGLSEKGKKVIKAMNDGDLFLILKDFDPDQTKALLKKARKPLLLLAKDIPEKSVLESVKKRDSAVGLIWGDEEPAVYIKKLAELKEVLGTQSIVFINESCLWGEKTKEALLEVFSEIGKSDFDRRELTNIFSGNLMRIMDLARGIQDQGFSF